MRYRAELRCYLCARHAATLEWEGKTPASVSVTRPGLGTAPMTPGAARAVRCVRCNGPTFVEEVEQVRRPLVVTIEPAKRGRPRKADKERELAAERDALARIA